ncbi:MAG: hypothetical protein ABFD75_05305 [Smithella sp.]
MPDFVGTACPGAGRGRRLPQRIINTTAEPVLRWRGLGVVAEADTLNATWYK